MARCFIGVMLPEGLKGSIATVKEELKRLPLKCKFVERENLHICLSFLGEVEDVKNVSEGLGLVCKDCQKFEVSIDGIKIIPNDSYIRVLALDVIDKTGNLEGIRKEVGKRIGGKSNPSHLTLCRVKTIDEKVKTVERIKSIKTDELSFTVSAVQIIKSELRKTGPIYTPISEVQLK